ncbi:MAG: lipopolysaccharide assembly protein LapA domain-containing protein [Cyanobacteria bacterium]|nr:lipopolysaccharide assembly protein LapA domain-containing protein [Cyanobacteriota bacterium]
MRLYIVSGLAIAFLAILFALQNTNLVTINLLGWQYQQSLALVLLLTLAIGVIVGLLVSTPAVIRRGWRVSRIQKQTDTLTGLLQKTEQQVSTETQRVQSVHQRYQALLSALDLKETTTGLLHSSILKQALGRQLAALMAVDRDRALSFSLLMLKVQCDLVDGVDRKQLWQGLTKHLQSAATDQTWLYSDGQGLYLATVAGLDAKAPSQYSETLQSAILEAPPPVAAPNSTLEASVGGAIASTAAPVDALQLINTAQTALAQAQERGRNRLRFLEATP